MKAQLVSIITLLIVCSYVANVGVAATNEAVESLVFPSSYKVVTVSNGGTINGVVKFEGDMPAMKKLEITKNVDVCGKTDKFDESLVVGEGNALKNTVVYLLDISEGANFATKGADGRKKKYEIDQNGCQFEPHVQIVPVGQQLTMINSDGIMHNIHIFTKKGYNKAQTKNRKKMRLPKVKKAEGPAPIKCDVHGWMSGWIAYFPHPYYSITNEKGEFKIENVPAGTYKLGYWHEACGTNKDAPATVTIVAGGAATQDFALTLKK